MIAEAEITRVKTGADIVAVAASYGLALTQKGKDHFAKCPFHEDTDASLSISQQKGVYHCFGCNAKGNVIQLVEKLAGVGFAEAFEIVAGKDLALVHTIHSPAVAINHTQSTKSPSTAPAEPVLDESEREKLLRDAFERMRHSFNTSPDGRMYLASRGLVALTDIEAGYCANDFAANLSTKIRASLQTVGLLSPRGTPHFADCVVFPLRNTDGKLTGLYGRRTKGSGKHFFLPGKREGVFAVRRGAERLIIAESVLDAATLAEKGFADVLALHGVNGWTATHREFVERFAYKHVYLVLDGDPAGHEAAGRLSMQLRDMGCKTHIVDLPDGEDPNSYLLSADALKMEKLQGELNALNPATGASLKLSEDAGNLVALGSSLKYTVSGLGNHSLEHMKVTLRIQNQGDTTRFYIDTVDLYSARHRERVADGAAKELDADAGDITRELKTLIRQLEEYRLKLLDATEKKPELTEQERVEALTSLRSQTLVDDILKDLGLLMVGEEDAKLVGYLGAISRLLEKPLGIVVVSRSGAGKTALQDAVCSLVPPESLRQYTRITGQTLFYGESDSLKHKVLAIEEEGGMEGAMYAIRTLQSSQKLVLATTRSDPKTGRFRQESYTVEGPVFIMISTTNPDALGGETRNRFVVLTIDESEEQTRRIVEATMRSHTLEGRMELSHRRKTMQRHHNMQRMLAPLEVVNPYARFLEYSIGRLQMRREQAKYACLIDAVALLHQHQREVKTYEVDGERHPYIEVAVGDIALANRLALAFFPNSTDELAPHTRRLGEEISRLVESKAGEVSFTRRELRSFCGWSDWQVREGLKQLEDLECVSRVAGRNGALITYEMLVDLRSDPDRGTLLLTDPVELARRMEEWQNAHT